MEQDILGLGVILAWTAGWAVAQGLKIVGFLAKNRKFDRQDLMAILAKSGGMPSGHTASLVSAVIFTGMKLGFGSVEFAILFCVTCIVMYDAVNVRWIVGEHGYFLQKVAKNTKITGLPERVVEGHTVKQVVGGVVVGILTGLLVVVMLK